MTPEMDGHSSTDADLLEHDEATRAITDDGSSEDLWDWEPEPGGGDGGGHEPKDPAELEHRERIVRYAVDAIVLAVCTVFVFATLHPADLLSSAVPAGGDMGAHVWGPAYLRDNLLPNLRLSGWTPDWYAGFPAYQFYMVVPSLLIVLLDVGLFGGWTLLFPVAAAGALIGRLWLGDPLRHRAWLVTGAVMVLLLAIELPYGTAFKVVTVLGLITLPSAAYAFGRFADLAFPGPALLAVATLPFLFDRNFTIYGGNVASTLAGEFAFSISLSLALVYLGVVIRGLRTGRHRALAAVLLALTGLCHLIPAFYALGGTAVIALMRRPALATLKWLAAVLPVGGLISAFWVLPFVWQRAYVNDMGWEKLPHENAENDFGALSRTLFTLDWGGETYWKYLVPRRPDMVQDISWVLALALIGLVLSLAFRVRLGWMLSAFVLVSAVAFVVMPQGRLWNARVLPFYYLSLYLLAAVGVSEVGRTLAVLAARDPQRPGGSAPAATAGLALLASLVLVGIPLRALPFGSTRADGSYSFFGLSNGSGDASFVRSWAKWNYTGYEAKDAYPEYREIVMTMDQVGEDNGCGRAFWEYEKELNRYGTPMALMLLPHWTDGCIGSMEGLFFEASATTPFHFLTQVELSAAPSAAQRDLPYDGFNIEEGIEHLQLMGVRYYMASSVQAITAARDHPDLTEIAASGPWVVFEVAGSNLVEGLENEPAVLEGVSDGQHDWICRSEDDTGRCAGPAVKWFKAPDAREVMLASSGPDEWQRVDVDEPAPDSVPLPEVAVNNVEVDNDSISFDVDQPGTPVLVKASYFPNWRVSGGSGPYRVAPNLMVVVPTDRHVELTYGREPVEWLAYLLTASGIVLAVWLARRPSPLRQAEPAVSTDAIDP
ncbi:MAG: 6-pyruvoyl-tetrahydropterin synthase-related protein [Actinomycetota bacterium]